MEKRKIEWKNDAALDVVVYNREFRKNNLKENIAGVFTLGQATIEEEKALEEMKEQRSRKSEDYARLNNSLQVMIQKESDRVSLLKSKLQQSGAK